VDAGADFAVTQPVFDAKQFETFLERTAEFDIPVIAGIWPLLSLGNAEFLANEVPGQHVPEAVIARMRKAQERGKAAAREEGIAIAREIIASIGNAVSGIHVSAPFGKVDVAMQVLEG
jgi:homocysteine S-methyltransferase